jgi:hypothetical protein
MKIKSHTDIHYYEIQSEQKYQSHGTRIMGSFKTILAQLSP